MKKDRIYGSEQIKIKQAIIAFYSRTVKNMNHKIDIVIKQCNRLYSYLMCPTDTVLQKMKRPPSIMYFMYND